MEISAFTSFVCPKDGLALFKKDNTLKCTGDHSYDVAREGYCNLLLVDQKSSLDPGDNKQMVTARGRFLDGEHFSPIVDHLFEIIFEIVTKSENNSFFKIVDAGCGEGYYLNRFNKLAGAIDHPAKVKLAGCDISKWAIKAAAKRSKNIAWVVAGNKQLPFAADSVDLILSIFGFSDWKGFKTVQPKGGRVLLVDPAVDHLIELRRIIYPTVKAAQSTSLDQAIKGGYFLEQEESLKFSINLKSLSQIQDLLAMTPHGFKVGKKEREDLAALNQLMVTVDLIFRTLQKKN